MEKKSNEEQSWFAVKGPFDDVVFSTRVRLIRNLADFPFTRKMQEDDFYRTDTLIRDALNSSEQMHCYKFNDVTNSGKEVLRDKNIIKSKSDFKCDSIILCDDESISGYTNETDHLKIAKFRSGLDIEAAMETVYKIDEMLQKKLQFAASFEFGYLTSRIKDCGTGMKISIRLFIPSIVLAGRFDETVAMLQEKGFCVQPVFRAGDSGDFSNCIFDIYQSNSATGTEFDQMAAIHSVGTVILKTERKFRENFADNNPTVVLNFVKRAYAKAMFSTLISYEDGVNIIATIKWGLQTGFLSGILDSDLNALLYRTKHGHLLYLSDSFSFNYEKDVRNDQNMKLQRLRAIIIQQAFEDIKFNK